MVVINVVFFSAIPIPVSLISVGAQFLCHRGGRFTSSSLHYTFELVWPTLFKSTIIGQSATHVNYIIIVECQLHMVTHDTNS